MKAKLIYLSYYRLTIYSTHCSMNDAHIIYNCFRPEEKSDIPYQSTKGMEPGKGHGSPTKIQNRKAAWGLPGLWIGSKHLPRLPETDDECGESMGQFNSKQISDKSKEAIYILPVKQETTSHDSSTMIVMSDTESNQSSENSPVITKSESKEAPELTTPSLQYDMVPHGELEGGMRRNAQSFDESMLGFVSEMPIPHDYMKQNKGFMSSLYGSLSELNIGKKSASSQPSSAESSRCSSPTGSLTERIKESGITASPGKMPRRFGGRLFRDINATTPSQW